MRSSLDLVAVASKLSDSNWCPLHKIYVQGGFVVFQKASIEVISREWLLQVHATMLDYCVHCDDRSLGHVYA